MIGAARKLPEPRLRRVTAAAVAEFAALDDLRQAAPEWAALCARAEPNPFAEPGFLLPLINYEKPKRLAFVLVRHGGRLIGFAALQLPRFGLGRVWMSVYAALPACAFDRGETQSALAAVTALLAQRTRLSGIVWPFVERGGAFAAALRGVAQAQGLPMAAAGGRRRAALKLAGAAMFDAGLDPKRAKKWSRKARKLSGVVTATEGPEGIEAFFAVEPCGWKGERRSALADDPSRAAFARAALQAFAREGRLDAMTLRLDGEPIAAGLVLTAGERAFYWKTAYDEAYAEASPGVQLTLAHSRRLAERPGLRLADSCAVEDHPMIGRVWGDSLEFEDWALGLRAGSERALAGWLWVTRARAGMAERTKGWVKRALGRKGT